MRQILPLLSASAFIFYGLLILVSNHMRLEFRRYKLERFRTLTGYLEVAGGAGQIAGLYISYLMVLSSAGLALLMLLGILVRIRSKDTWTEIVPALVLMLMNILIIITEVL